MGKLTVVINDETEKMLREYVSKKYPMKTFGKLSEVVDSAIMEYLQNRQPTPV